MAEVGSVDPDGMCQLRYFVCTGFGVADTCCEWTWERSGTSLWSEISGMFAFMDDLTVVQQSADGTVEVLELLERLI